MPGRRYGGVVGGRYQRVSRRHQTYSPDGPAWLDDEPSTGRAVSALAGGIGLPLWVWMSLDYHPEDPSFLLVILLVLGMVGLFARAFAWHVLGGVIMLLLSPVAWILRAITGHLDKE